MAQPLATGRVVRNRNFTAMEHTQMARKLLRTALANVPGPGSTPEDITEYKTLLQELGNQLDGAANSLWANEVDLARAAMRGKYEKR